MNLKVRAKNPLFWVQIGMSILAPVLAYMGLTVKDLTSWSAVGNVLLTAVSNPYVLGLALVSAYNAMIDPTTPGIKDSVKAMMYNCPGDSLLLDGMMGDEDCYGETEDGEE